MDKREAGGRQQGKKCKREGALTRPDFQREREGRGHQASLGIPALVNHKGLLAVGDGFLLCLLPDLPRVRAGPLAVP